MCARAGNLTVAPMWRLTHLNLDVAGTLKFTGFRTNDLAGRDSFQKRAVC